MKEFRVSNDVRRSRLGTSLDLDMDTYNDITPTVQLAARIMSSRMHRLVSR